MRAGIGIVEQLHQAGFHFGRDDVLELVRFGVVFDDSGGHGCFAATIAPGRASSQQLPAPSQRLLSNLSAARRTLCSMAPMAADRDGARLKALVVDDEPNIVDFIKLGLGYEGF